MYEAGAREAPPRPPAVRAYAPAVQPRHALLAVAVAAAWGANFVAIAIGLEGMSPLVLASARFALSALPVLVLYRDGPGVPWRPLLVASAASGIAQFALLFSGIEAGMPAGLSSLVLQVQALFTILIAAGVLGERPTRLQLAGVLVSMAGLLGIAVERGASAGFAPFLLVIGAAVGWAVGNVATRVARPTDPFRFVAWWSVGPPLPLLGLAAVVDGPGVLAAAARSVTWAAVAGLLYIVVVSTFFGYTVWNRLLARYPASAVAPFTLLVPIFGVLSAWAALGERPTLVEVAAGVVVLAGLVLVSLQPRSARRVPVA